MARRPQKLTVIYSTKAQLALNEIWNWNAREYGPNHADRYIRFLESETDKLATSPGKGRPVPGRPKYSYLTIKRRPRGYGHIAVYEVVTNTVEILNYYHTSQD